MTLDKFLFFFLSKKWWNYIKRTRSGYGRTHSSLTFHFQFSHILRCLGNFYSPLSLPPPLFFFLWASAENFLSVDLVAAWHERGQRLTAVSSESDGPPAAARQWPHFSSLTLRDLDKVVNQLLSHADCRPCLPFDAQSSFFLKNWGTLAPSMYEPEYNKSFHSILRQ